MVRIHVQVFTIGGGVTASWETLGRRLTNSHGHQLYSADGSPKNDMAPTQQKDDGIYIALISVHGLIRGQELELGRDSDTGGQIRYVVELSRALALHPAIQRVDLFTRRVEDPAVGDDYARPEEQLGPGARIVRIDAGPAKYIRKELLWDHLDAFADGITEYLQTDGRLPDFVHSHYADAGYVGMRICSVIGVPLVHTGHSLGRVKRRRLLAAGLSKDEVEEQYNISRRIEAEETTLATAERVIASTSQEVEEQYRLYDHYSPEQMKVIPPGTDLECFFPPRGDERNTPFARRLGRFLENPDKPMILAISRPDPRKNISGLLTAFGESPKLQAIANLVIVAGNREDIQEMEDGPRDVLNEVLQIIDRHDLYGRVAAPKQHASDEVPMIYRLAAESKGVFINPALTEPFGLTLIEAAASGLPVVATNDGGPRDILGNCDNGILVDVLDTEAMARALIDVLSDEDRWQERADSGLRGVQRHYSWTAHVERFVSEIRPVIEGTAPWIRPPKRRRPMLHHDRALFTDIDQNLLGDPESLQRFLEVFRSKNDNNATFGIATGRRLDSALKVMRRHKIPEPDILITSGGTEIYYAPELTQDKSWARHVDHHWTPHVVRRVVADLPGIERQPKIEQSRFKLSYYYDPSKAPSIEEINSLLHQEEQSVNAYVSFGQFLDILPIRASKGSALRYFALRWAIPLERVLVAGGSGADEDMMRGNTLAAVVGNRHNEELSQLVDLERIYFAQQEFAAGILEAIEHYDFFNEPRVPEPES